MQRFSPAVAALVIAAAFPKAAGAQLDNLFKMHTSPHLFARNKRSCGTDWRVRRSMYKPHQGKQEIARRQRQIANGQLDFSASGQEL